MTLPPSRLLTAEEVAQILGVSRSTFYTLKWWRRKRVLVSARRVGYRAEDVETYIRLRTNQPHQH